ncbi:MAG: hypothetical protein ACI83D_000254 [Planctomycetota bacterium]|jgi:hypothetical protein
MIKKSLLSLFVLCSLAVPSAVHAQFLRGDIWLSESTPLVSETVRIYVSHKSSLEGDVVGKLKFFDGETLLGEQSFESIDDSPIESWFDWTPVVAGEHALSVSFVDVLVSEIGGTTREIETTITTLKATTVIDTDTDKDGVGDKEDTDDDGGGVSDAEELENGTDPKNPKDDNSVSSLEEKLGEVIGDVEGSVDFDEGVEQFIGPGQVSSGLENFHESTRALGGKLSDQKTILAEGDTDKGFFQMIWGVVLGIGIFIFSHPLVTDILIVVILIYVIKQLFRKRKRPYHRRSL